MSRSIEAKTSIIGSARILSESESLAFAGLLFDIGKRLPTLFAGVLKPLLRDWVLLDWDRQVATLRHHDSGAMGYWGFQAATMIEGASMVRHASSPQPVDLSEWRHHPYDDGR